MQTCSSRFTLLSTGLGIGLKLLSGEQLPFLNGA